MEVIAVLFRRYIAMTHTEILKDIIGKNTSDSAIKVPQKLFFFPQDCQS